MSVTCLIDCISRNAGGIHSSTLRLMQSLALQGPDVRVVSVWDELSGEDQQRWHPLPVSLAKSFGPRSLGFSPHLFRLVQQSNPTLVITHGLWTHSSFVSFQHHSRTRIPSVLYPHGMLDPWALKNSGWKKQLALAWFERRHLQQSSCLVALCKAERDSLRALGLSNPIAVIPNGIDLPKLTTFDPSARHSKVLLFLGRLHPKKGLVALLKAWSLFGQSNPNAGGWTLVISGWDQMDHEATLQSLATELGLPWIKAATLPPSSHPIESGSVVFLGPHFDDAKERLFRSCDAFILPSLSEGLPMSVLEAWAHAKPVLMTSACNLPEGFASGSAIAIDPDPQGILKGLQDLASRPASSLAQMGARGRALVEDRFTWFQAATQLNAIRRWLVEGAERPPCVEGP